MYESNHISNHKYKGIDVAWRKIFSDNDGVFRLENYYNQISKTGFVADGNFITQKDSDYHLFLGCSGNTICEVNGKKVYESTESMDMFPSQIHVVLSLSRGLHSIRIKTEGNRKKVCSFSIQLFDDLGNPVKREFEAAEKGVIKNYSSSFGNCISFGSGFNEQYLRYMSGLNINTQAEESKDRLEEEIISPYQLFYQSLLESNPSIIEKKLK